MAETIPVSKTVKKNLKSLKTEVQEAKKVPKSVKKNIRSLRSQVKEARKVPKSVKKDLSTLKSKLEKGSAVDEKQSKELEKLRADLEALKKKGTKKKKLSAYNLFVRRQLLIGKTFAQAARLWKNPNAKTAKPKSKKPAKAKPAKRKPGKPKPAESIKSNYLKDLVQELKIHRQEVSSVKGHLNSVVDRLKSGEKAMLVSMLERKAAEPEDVQASGTEKVSDEETAVKLAGLYFKEVARLGFKRSLELDSVINAYFYALARIRRKEFESKEIIDAVRDSKMSSKSF